MITNNIQLHSENRVPGRENYAKRTICTGERTLGTRLMLRVLTAAALPHDTLPFPTIHDITTISRLLRTSSEIKALKVPFPHKLFINFKLQRIGLFVVTKIIRTCIGRAFKCPAPQLSRRKSGSCKIDREKLLLLEYFSELSALRVLKKSK